jgi:stage II sporulation protein D
MKVWIVCIAVLAVAIVGIPMLAVRFPALPTEENAVVHAPTMPAVQEPVATPSLPEVSEAPAQSSAMEMPENEDEVEETVIIAEAEPLESDYGVQSFLILDQTTGEVVEVSLREYERGAVASEMPVSFHPEALKAQAVAAHTYALHHHYTQLQTPDPTLQGADFAADPSNMKVYITEETAREFYGEEYADAYWAKICEAVDSVLPYILEYEEEPIVAAYHAISAGQTEAAENVWVGSADYLQPTISEGDYLAPDYEVETVISIEEVRNTLQNAYPEMDLSGDPETWFAQTERSQSGYILSIVVGGVDVPGKDLRTLFDLRSHNMDIAYTDAGFSFITYGHGHGVGLSQYGADFMARQGYTYDQILEHYYQGATLRRAAGAIESV